MHQENGDARYFWWFMLFALVVLGAGLGLRSPWPADEPRFVLVAKQMWESGEWLFPHRGHELYADKPPLYFWLLAGAYALVRNWDAAFLIPSLLAALGTLALTYDFARRQWDRRAGLWAAGAVLCAFQFAYQAKRAQIDPTVVFFITLGVYGIGRHVLSTGPNWRWYWLGCFAAGLGVISKGVGFLALLALLPYVWMRWRTNRGDTWHGVSSIAAGQAGRWLLGGLAFLGAIALWLVPMVVVALTSGDPEHRAYLDDLLFRQTATRYVSAWHHHQPFWYYGEVILLFWLPFSLFIPWLIGRWRDAWRQRDARVWWPLLWVLLVLVFFTASSGKRDMYILPALPALALSAAPFMAAIAQRRGLRWLLLSLAALIGVLFLGAGLAALLADPGYELKLEAQRGLTGTGADHLWLAVAAMGALILVAAVWTRARRAVTLMLAMVAILWIGYGVLVAPQLDGESSGRDLMQQARVEAGADTTIGLVGWREQQLLQALGPVEEFGFKAPTKLQWQRGLAWLRERPGDRALMIQAGLLPACVDRESAHPLGVANRRSWWLVKDHSTASCR
ncbi:ArnT family glycosyltransferase [Pseudoxanthomonas sp. UTMC 1351]|uniref:ArnT family glycosyltransferase n=1 Tax=Pseudoxanthomonas sp. UTMC 1351 TaxID=2695853 RepID=UPI0034CE7AB3